jgi:hypothetical protein
MGLIVPARSAGHLSTALSFGDRIGELSIPKMATAPLAGVVKTRDQ